MKNRNSIIFGPIISRRFGVSLGVDLSPNKKQCNFDCLYCELQASKVVDSYKDVIDYKIIVDEVKKGIKKFPDIDVLTFTANGEPTLYPDLEKILDEVLKIKSGIKSLILSNSSTIYNKKVQNTLKKFDIVKLSLDCVTEKCFKKIDRASKNIDIENIKSGIKEFAKSYDGELIVEILVVKGVNDKVEEIRKIDSFLKDLKISRVDLGTVDRPPAYNIEGVDYKKLVEISMIFNKSTPIYIVGGVDVDKISNLKADFSSQEIIETLKRRPLTKKDIDILFDRNSIQRLNYLLSIGQIETEKIGEVEFFKSS